MIYFNHLIGFGLTLLFWASLYTGIAAHSSSSTSRKAASAQIAKIPLPLSQWIARTYKP